MRFVRRLIGLALFVAVLVGGWRFATENSSPVSVSYLVGELGAVPLWAALLVAFGAGMAFTGVVALLQLARVGMVSRRYRKTAHGLEAEVHQLRNLPLSADTAVEPGPAASAPGAGALERGA